MESLDNNGTWDLIRLPNGRKLIGYKWVFKNKLNTTGQVDKYKARLVAEGYSQVKGVKFGEIFSPVEKLTSIRLLLYLAIVFDLEIKQLDVKIVFLRGDLEAKIYMKQPEGFIWKGKGGASFQA